MGIFCKFVRKSFPAFRFPVHTLRPESFNEGNAPRAEHGLACFIALQDDFFVAQEKLTFGFYRLSDC
jgi:hypothetical protein